MTAPLPLQEAERLQALSDYGLMDTPPEPVFDEVVALASYVFRTPIALIPLLDAKRQWFKSRVGLDLTETPREHAFCSYTILEPTGMVVPDALADPRFADNPLVVGKPGIRFYAGTPLKTREGHALGTLCVIDTKPRPQLDPEQKQALHTLGRHLMAQLEVRYSSAFLAKALRERSQAQAEEQNRMVEHGRELTRLNESKDRFMTMLAHELRNPLASILNAIELLRSPEPAEAVEIIEGQVKHLSRLIEDLLDLSRFTRGKITLKMATLDFVEIVRAATRATHPVLAKKGQPFVTEFPEQPLWVNADPIRLEQIVSNLLINAAKFTSEGKRITLSLKRESAAAVLRVRDEGMGIPREMQERIFEPYVQVEESRTNGGLGLGLPLVRQLVSLHQGSVQVQSDGLGRGSEFIVQIPLHDAPVRKPAAQATNGDADPKPRIQCRVLLVEDNPHLSKTLERLISHWGHMVDLVHLGSDALEKARQFRPDVALIDIGLPEMDGFAVAECLRAAQELAGTRLIAMSGFGTEADRARALQAGFHEFLLKPVDPAFLRGLLEG
ncbi:MAG: ATP-binding protein [Verrucomicrobia bacterium]|nr:ATP-binding protein [Verrucomicrobiota bacterium]